MKAPWSEQMMKAARKYKNPSSPPFSSFLSSLLFFLSSFLFFSLLHLFFSSYPFFFGSPPLRFWLISTKNSLFLTLSSYLFSFLFLFFFFWPSTPQNPPPPPLKHGKVEKWVCGWTLCPPLCFFFLILLALN